MEMSYKIGIIGLGYVGFPLACLFAKKYPVVAFDINTSRVKALQSGEDSTLEVSSESITSESVNGANELTTQFGANLNANKHCILHIKNT